MCPFCRSLLATPEGQQLIGAFRAGIEILLLAPFAAFVVVAVAALRSQRKLHNRQK